MINRGAIIVRPRQPYIDWAAQLDDAGLLPSPDGERTVYLVPEYGDEVEAMDVLSQCYDIIFEAELEAWYTDDTAWPGDRTFALFRDWFDVEFHSLVDDLCSFEIIDDDEE